MKGLRRRVSVGFLSIAVLLFISGVIAFVELNTLSDDTRSILDENRDRVELSRNMLELMQKQNDAFVEMTIFENSAYDTVAVNTLSKIETTFSDAYNQVSANAQLDSLSLKITELKLLTATVVNVKTFDDLERSSRAEYYREYRPIYSDIVGSIYDLTSASLWSIEPRAEQLQRNAYRTVTPVLISLAVMILIVLMLYYFMIIYCVNPVVRLNRSLQDFTNFKLPFKPKGDFMDEFKELEEGIDNLTTQVKQVKRDSK